MPPAEGILLLAQSPCHPPSRRRMGGLQVLRIRNEGGNGKESLGGGDLRSPRLSESRSSLSARGGRQREGPWPAPLPRGLGLVDCCRAANARSRAPEQTHFSSTYSGVIDLAATVSARAGLGSGSRSRPLHTPSAGRAGAESPAPTAVITPRRGRGCGGRSARQAGSRARAQRRLRGQPRAATRCRPAAFSAPPATAPQLEPPARSLPHPVRPARDRGPPAPRPPRHSRRRAH